MTSISILAVLHPLPLLAEPKPAAAEEESPAQNESPLPNDSPAPKVSPAPKKAAPSLKPPELVEFVSAEYPAEALSAGLEGEVVLKLKIAADGTVNEAEIAESAAPGLDAAARNAALQFKFSPALRNGAPIASIILYTYSFKLPQPSDELAAPPSPAVAASTEEPTTEEPTTEEPINEAAPNSEAAPNTKEEPIQKALEVTVRGTSEAERLERSAKAVQVIELEEAAEQTADLGEALARNEGVGVRRGGGLGSSTRFSLNGLTGDQIRFFIDGVPLEFAGYPFGIANVPVNLIERVEIYRGVVPIRFGADALGGAVHLVTDDARQTGASASYQFGSFETHRLTLAADYVHEPSGFVARFNGFLDAAENNFPVDVEVADDRGRISEATVYRFHDAYLARGAGLEAGFIDRPWAHRLILRAFATEYDKELQHNPVMTIPYGEATYGERVLGATLRYEQLFGAGLSTEIVGGYTYGSMYFLDVADCVYDWFGRCGRERRIPGETSGRPIDQLIWERAAFMRANIAWRIADQHALRLAIAPTYTSRTGVQRRQSNPEARDPLAAERSIRTLVSGLEYTVDLFDDRLENVTFIKDYLQFARSDEIIVGGATRNRDRTTHRLGFGDALRYRFLDWLYAKASYEWATRLPRADELFGDGALIKANPELKPESSHNLNLGVDVAGLETSWGTWKAGLNFFLREADQLIIKLGKDRNFSYQNVSSARSAGLEVAAGWSAPGEWLALDANLTYQDLRNTSSAGKFAKFEGDRLPNRPHLFANASAQLEFDRVLVARDAVSLDWNSRYVHEFFRGWQTLGLLESKDVIASQLLHSLALTYRVDGRAAALSTTLEVQNLTDQPAFDFFGVQRPGRAFYFKTTLEI
jgi:TonB family protein